MAIELDHHITVDGTAYRLLWLTAREPLDELGELRCDLSDDEGGPDPARLVGKPLVLKVTRKEGAQERTIAGYVTEAHRSTFGGEADIGTQVVARPRLFRLTQRA